MAHLPSGIDSGFAAPVAPAFGAAPAHVRVAGPGDLPGLRALVHRCSPHTLYRRFHGAGGRAVQRELERIASPHPSHRSWVAVADGAIRGTATLARGASAVPEVAFLVEDAWFRRGVGRSLFAAVRDGARRSGAKCVVAAVQADNDRAIRFVRAMAPAAALAFEAGELQITVLVDPAGCDEWTAAPNPGRRARSATAPDTTREAA